MPQDSCSIDDCDKKAFGRGWCKMHHNRWLRHGDPLVVLAFRGTPEERLQHYMDRRGDDDCWLWQGSIDKRRGYGVIAVDGKSKRAHRFAYELEYGPIPDDHDIDHHCHDPEICSGGIACPHRRCCNPRHMLAVGPGVNNSADRCISRNRDKTHCPRGHEYTPENTKILDSGSRACRSCSAAASRARYAAAKRSLKSQYAPSATSVLR